jgi:BASS family bile acid:Na+ symporter
MRIALNVKVKEFLANNALVMIVAFVIAMLFGGFPEAYPRMNKDVAMFSLMVMMSFSLCNLKLRGLNVAQHTYSIQRAFVLSFLLGTGATIAMAFLFSGDIRDGWILVAAVPSAVSVIPFVLILGGDLESTLVSSAGLYFIALLFTPFLTLIFLGEA